MAGSSLDERTTQLEAVALPSEATSSQPSTPGVRRSDNNPYSNPQPPAEPQAATQEAPGEAPAWLLALQASSVKDALTQRFGGRLLATLLEEQPQRQTAWLNLTREQLEAAHTQAQGDTTTLAGSLTTHLKTRLDQAAGLTQAPTATGAALDPETRAERAAREAAANRAFEETYDQALADGYSYEEAERLAAAASVRAGRSGAAEPAPAAQGQAQPRKADTPPGRPSTGDLAYIRSGWLAELDARANRPHSHYTTGLEPFDQVLGGGYLEGLHIIGGITGGGKTSLALSIALHNAQAERSVIYVTYEQSRLELWARIAASLTPVPYAAIKRGTYHHSGKRTLASHELKSSPGWANLEAAAQHLRIVEGGDALSHTDSGLGIEDLATLAHQVTEERGAPPLVVVDYLQRMPAPRIMRDARERIGYAAGQLQMHLGRGAGCPVIALSSVNRASYRLASLELEARLASLKEAGEIEYTAYTATLVYGLPGEKQGPMMTPGALAAFTPMVLDVVKHREGRPDRVAVKWTPAKDRWYDATPYGADTAPL